MKSSTLVKIHEAVNKAGDLPNVVIEYSFEELPDVKGIKSDNFFGVKAKYNKSVSKEVGYVITYKY